MCVYTRIHPQTFLSGEECGKLECYKGGTKKQGHVGPQSGSVSSVWAALPDLSYPTHEGNLENVKETLPGVAPSEAQFWGTSPADHV